MKAAGLIVLTFILMLYSGLFAQENDTTRLFEFSLDELLQVTIASNVVSDIKQQPVSVFTISRQQLELSGARTLNDAIMIYVPGFFVVEDQDDVIAGFRGLAPDNNSKVMLLINGQSMNTEWFWGPPATILSSTNFSYIEKIEIIRGPGSVTLGQGALLGVINIITKSGKYKDEIPGTQNNVQLFKGLNDFNGISAEAFFKEQKFNGYLQLAFNEYNGQIIRNEGWAKDKKNEGFDGGSIFDIGTRIKKSTNNNIIGSFDYENFQVNLLYAGQKRDLYNFYRDRNQASQNLMAVGLQHKLTFNDKISIKTSIDGAIDDFALYSVKGYTMGGTREDRIGGKIVGNFDQLVDGNRLAAGIEFRHFEFGKQNFEGNNFINNVLDSASIKNYSNYLFSANKNKIWGYEDNLNVMSIFLEDFQTIGKKIDLFGALRYDRHPFWGTNISPRIGLLLNASEKIRMRISYQSGFRGAVGVHYAGGYKSDGLLREENFTKIAGANIHQFDNIKVADISTADATDSVSIYIIKPDVYNDVDKTLPETMHSFELSLTYEPTQKITFTCVGFYNIIQNVIDVGVIWTPGTYYNSEADYYADPVTNRKSYIIPDVGSDIHGDWNGYWYFKNTEGNIHQGGFEAMLHFKSDKFTASLSQSIVRLLYADKQQRASMYITSNDNFKAFPENVTRLNLVGDITNHFALGINYVYYYNWISPQDQKVKGNHLVNLSSLFKFTDHFSGNLSVINLLGQRNLYPMNSNAGGADLSDGTPALESTTFWVGIQYKF